MALNLSKEELQILRNRVYQGYKGFEPYEDSESITPKIIRPSGIDYNWYSTNWMEGKKDPYYSPSKETTLWESVRDELGIERVNRESDLRQMYDYVLGYQYPEPTKEVTQDPDLTPLPIAPLETLKVQAPSTPQVSTSQSQDQIAALTKALADAQASFQAQIGEQTKSYQDQLAAYQTLAQEQLGAYQTQAQQQYAQQQQQFETFQQQSQAQLIAAQQQAEESKRQMMIGLAQRNRAPAEVKMAESGAAQQGLTRRGTTGYFGRLGMRIGSLNVPSSGLTISADAAGRAASGSFM